MRQNVGGLVSEEKIEKYEGAKSNVAPLFRSNGGSCSLQALAMQIVDGEKANT